ncbi:MAG: PIN domain-containing protein [Caulobacteraceae bacterium]
MVTFSLDSTTVVDILRGHGDVRSRFAAAAGRGDCLIVSSVVLHELSYGAWRSGRPEAKLRELEVFLRRVQVEAFQAEDALETGRLRAHLADLGGSVGAYDEMIAGQALARSWTVVTSNVRHFLAMGDVAVADWRRGEHAFTAAERTEIILELMKAKK